MPKRQTARVLLCHHGRPSLHLSMHLRSALQCLPMLHVSLLYASKATRPAQFVQAQLTLDTNNIFSLDHSSVIV